MKNYLCLTKRHLSCPEVSFRGVTLPSHLVVVLLDPFRGMGRRGTPRRPTSWATPQGLD